MNANAGSTKDAEPAPGWATDSISAIIDAAPFKAAIAALWKNAPDVRRMFRSVPILGCFTIKVADGEMRLSHHAIDMDVTAHLRAAGSGHVVIPATALRAFVAACDGDEVKLHKEVGGARVVLSCGSARASVIPMAVADLPMCFENLPEPARTFELAEGVFKWLTALPAACWSTEETRYYLNGICFEIGDKEVRAVATNGHMLGFRKAGVSHALAAWDCKSIIPREALGSVFGVIGGKEIRVELFSMKGERHKTEQTVMGKVPVGEKIPFEDPYRVRFTSPGWTISAKLVDGTYPDWRRVVPQPQAHTLLELNANAMKRASAVAGKTKGAGIDTRAVRISRHEHGATFTVKNPELGDFVISAPGTSTAGFHDFGVNVHYLATLASALAKPAVRLEVIDPGSPIRIEPADNLTGEFAILMPMRV